MTGTLANAVKAEGVEDIMDVQLVPYGNAELNNRTKSVTCQHGTSECEGNLWEMCSIFHYPEFSDHWPFYYCMESLGEEMILTENVKRCATAAGMSYDTLSNCFNDPDEAWELEQHFAALTPSYHTYTPWVEVPTGSVLDHQSLFLYTVCDQYAAAGGDIPPGCPQYAEVKSEKCPKE